MSKKLKVYTCFRRGFISEAKLKILTKQYDEVGTVDTIEVDTIGKIFEKNKLNNIEKYGWSPDTFGIWALFCIYGWEMKDYETDHSNRKT